MFRKSIFWILFVAVSLVCIYFSARYFSRAFPIVTLDLRMNRESALAQAAELASRFQLPPAGYRQVASFTGDQEAQNFVELEGGGTAAFRSMMAEGLYYPYKWSVRHYKPGETRETRLLFTPRGNPYGFSVKLPEKEAGAALNAEQAQAIAEQAAGRDWTVDLSRYRLVEKGQETRPGGRVDHTFVYERPDVQVGEGRYRLRLVTGGDKLTELTHFVKVPEGFSRRYEEMRSANTVIGTAGSIAMVVLYFMGGCCVGLFFLLRQRWIVWRKPLLWGIFIAFLQLLAGINQWPLIWMNYDTAISSQGFVLQQILMIVLNFLLNTGLFAISFTAAESLSRRAFPSHSQMWSLWSPRGAGSKTVLGQTTAGYLLVGAFFAYEVLLYFLTTRSLGWWTPSDILVQPDILATYLPWLSPIAISAQAGFWEECLFRAVPLACAALLGARYGRRGWWIAGAMVLQALIFGSGHAGYANQPSYARLVELIIPSFMFGGLYLCFGLLPGIVLHYAYDVVWMALPLFVSSTPGIWWHRTFVIVLVLVPLWIVFRGRLRARQWSEFPEELTNRAWSPPEPAQYSEPAERPAAGSIHPAVVRFLPIIGILGIVLWGFASKFRPDAPALTGSIGEARAVARRALEDRHLNLSDSWSALVSVLSRPGDQDRFVWQTAGKGTYNKLIQEYLTPPAWHVRFVRFEGDVADRAEEYQVWISDAKGAFRVKHILPEARAGSNVSEQEARVIAHQALKAEFGLDPVLLKEVSAVPSKLKARTDWAFTFADSSAPALPQGEKRIGIQIGGDKVLDAYRFVHVPEDWQREQRDKETIPTIVRIGCTVLVVILVITGIAAAIFSWSKKRFIVSTFLILGATLLILNLVDILNSIPALTAQFSTAQPFKVQMFLLLGIGILGVLLLAAGMGLIGGMLQIWSRESTQLPRVACWTTGLSLGGLVAGLSALGSALGPSLVPTWGDFNSLGVFLPFLDASLGPPASFLTQSLTALLLFAGVDRLTRGWTAKKALFGSLLFLFGFVVAGARGPEVLSAWLVAGAITGAVLLAGYVLVVRYSLAVVLPAVALGQILAAARQAIQSPIPGGFPATLASIVIIVSAAWFGYRFLRR